MCALKPTQTHGPLFRATKEPVQPLSALDLIFPHSKIFDISRQLLSVVVVYKQRCELHHRRAKFSFTTKYKQLFALKVTQLYADHLEPLITN